MRSGRLRLAPFRVPGTDRSPARTAPLLVGVRVPDRAKQPAAQVERAAPRRRGTKSSEHLSTAANPGKQRAVAPPGDRAGVDRLSQPGEGIEVERRRSARRRGPQPAVDPRQRRRRRTRSDSGDPAHGGRRRSSPPGRERDRTKLAVGLRGQGTPRRSRERPGSRPARATRTRPRTRASRFRTHASWR